MATPKLGHGAIAFGALGVLWAPELASLLRVGCYEHDAALGLVVLPILLPWTMAIVGLSVAWIAANMRRRDAILAIALLVPASGMVTGALAGLLWWPDAIGEAIVDGLAFGAVALVLLAPLVRPLGSDARRGSLVGSADRRTLWVRVGLAASLASVLTLPLWKTYPVCESDPDQAIGATVAASAIALVASVLVLVHVIRSYARLARPAFVDVGVGEGRNEIYAPKPTAYRHPVELLGVVYGDAALARKRLRWHAWGAVFCAGLAIAAGFAGVALRV